MRIAVAIDTRVTVASAAIEFICVAIVTVFKARLTLTDVSSHNPITADGRATIASTRIIVGIIAIIALLKKIMIGAKVHARDAIAAGGDFATIGAGIGSDLVAVIAGFIRLKITVAAFRWCFAHHHLFRTGAKDQQ